jgi:hypothetical protein
VLSHQGVYCVLFILFYIGLRAWISQIEVFMTLLY